MASVPTYAERAAKRKQAKPSRISYSKPKSRKPKHVAKRKPVTDSTGVVRHAKAMKTVTHAQFRSFLEQAPPDIIDLVSSSDEEEEEEETKEASDDDESKASELAAIVDVDADSSMWPDGTEILSGYINKEGIRFFDVGALDPCRCVSSCTPQSGCMNVETGILCTRSSCNVHGDCGNRGNDVKGLYLRRGSKGYAVYTSHDIAEGSVVAAYWGELTHHDFENDTDQKNAYALEVPHRSTARAKVFIDASRGGGISRFMNHSCSPKCVFLSRRSRREVRVLVVAVTQIKAGEEVTVHYRDDPWFDCTCGAENCVGLDQ